MFFSNRHNQELPVVCVDGINITRTDCIKFLGVYIDDGLTWKQHINHIATIISRNIGMISKMKWFFPHDILLVLYNTPTCILQYISYGILAWGNSGAGTINRILQLQKKALRIINNVNFCGHSNPLFYNCNTLKVTDIYSLQLGSFM